MSDDKTWSMKDMEMVWAEGKSPDANKPDAPVSELAKAVNKPAYHNSKIKAALLLLGGTCLAVLGTLLFTLTNGNKSSENNVATVPENITQPAAASNDGWETASKQSTSDAGAGIDIAKKSVAEETSTPSTSTPTTTSAVNNSVPKTEQKTAASTVVPVPPVVKASHAVKMPTQVGAEIPRVAPKPIVMQPVVAKAIPYIPANVPVKPTPRVLSKPEPEAKPVVVTQPVAKPIVTQPVIPSVPMTKPEAKPVTPPVAVAASLPPTSMSWEQASVAGVYGGESSSVMPQAVGGLGVAPGVKDGTKQQSSYDGVMSPTLLLPAGTKAKGRTLAPYAVGISKNQSDAMPLSIALDESIELGKGYHLPVGTTINFIASVRDNGSVVAVSKNADIGGVEVQLPDGAISLASESGLLMAKEVSTGGADLTRADVNSSIWSGIAGAGKAILQTGGQTTTNTGLLGTTTTQTNNGSPNIIGGVLDGAFTPLATNGVKRAQQKAEEIEKRSKLNTIDVGTKVKLFVNVPVQVQIPVSGQQVGQTTEEEELPPPRLITSNSIQSTSNAELPPPALTPTAVVPPLSTQPIVTQQPATTAVIQSPLELPPSVVPQPLSSELPRSTQTSVVPPLVVKSQPPTTPLPLPLHPPKTRISRPW